MKKFGILCLATAIAISYSGCATKKKIVVKQPTSSFKQEVSGIKQVENIAYMIDIKNVNEKRPNYSINVATTVTIKDTVDKIAKQLVSTLRKKYVGNIAITSFVDLHQLNKTTHFGRVLGESLFNELFRRGVGVLEVRERKMLTINANGEFFISRDIKKINTELKNRYILIGTYTKISEGVLINSRIVDNKTGEVIATSRVIFHSNDCRIFENCENPKKEPIIKITTDRCAEEKCPCIGRSSGYCEKY